MKEIRSMFASESSREKLKRLEKHCSEKKVPFSRWENVKFEGYLIKITKPNFSDLDFYVTSEKDLDALLEIGIENIAGLNSISGYVDLKKSVIEAHLVGTSIFGTIKKEKLLGAGQNEIVLKSEKGGPEIRIGIESAFSAELRNGDYQDLSIRISGIKVTSDEDAEIQIKKYCSQLFFTIMEKKNLGLRLRRRIRRGYRSLIRERLSESLPPSKLELNYPQNSLSFVPVALLAATTDPFLPPSFQFLLNYQAVEFFLTKANRIDAHNAIKSLLEDPSFNPSEEKHTTKLLALIKPQWINPMKKELEQLISLFSHSSLISSVRKFLEQDGDVVKHLSAAHKFTEFKITSKMSDSKLALTLASRVYDIRNAIVHSKDEERTNKPLLLLQSADEEIVDLDSAMLGFLAKEIVKLFGVEGAL